MYLHISICGYSNWNYKCGSWNNSLLILIVKTKFTKNIFAFLVAVYSNGRKAQKYQPPSLCAHCASDSYDAISFQPLTIAANDTTADKKFKQPELEDLFQRTAVKRNTGTVLNGCCPNHSHDDFQLALTVTIPIITMTRTRSRRVKEEAVEARVAIIVM